MPFKAPYRRGYDDGLNGTAPAFCPWREAAPYWLGYMAGRRRLKQCVGLMAQTIADLPIAVHRKDQP